MAIKEKNIARINGSLLSSIKIIGIGVLQLTLLAQLVQANEINLLAITIITLLVIDALSDFGFNNIIIRNTELNNADHSILYWGNVLTGALLFSLLFISGDIASRSVSQPQLAMMLEMISVVFIIIPQGQHYRAILQREKQVSRIAIVEMTSVLMGLGVTLFTVWLTPSVLCAIWGYLAMASIRMLMFCYYGRAWFQPAFRFSFTRFAQLRARKG
ncbi:oligosaccharide flippase family protein [Pantoea sp. Mb-10]|uniref:oligosaccharide flippase family protein n=1 Tax=unclassified Pantoea TaxID=2630326 RepID=UPI001E3115DF|nr:MULTISPECIES: oligosaccharide flippase family protein [unclassified Pantoea]MCE0491968.1 oligosaccharide flippase family protein [Pantoea sp. Mb-10]MCE0503527.1 oligosaccharide flippase family protein [Pantoea sp. Pb-8]